MIKITDGGPKDLLPPSLKNDPWVQAFSYAVEQGMMRMIAFSRRTMLYAAIDEMPEYLLDYMAVESKVIYYDESVGIQVKRELLKNSLAWSMKAGTQEIVSELMQVLFGEGKAIPWYEFEGEPGVPGTFDVSTNARMEENLYEKLMQIIWLAKNQSSILRYITIEHEADSLWSALITATQEHCAELLNDIMIDNPDQTIFLNEFFGINEDSQIIDRILVGGIDTLIEESRTHPLCMANSCTSEMQLFESLEEISSDPYRMIACGFTQASETVIKG